MRTIEVSYNANGTQGINDSNGVGQGEVVAIHFKTPATVGAGGGWIGFVEHTNASGGGVPVHYQGALNTTPGDLSTDIGVPGASSRFANALGPTINFRGQPVVSHGQPQPTITLQPNTDYYLNVQQMPGSGVPFSGIKIELTPTKNK
jgi:hypothetical protein